MKEVVWSPEALEDADSYAAIIELDSPATAARWLDKAEQLANQAARHPRIGRVVPEFGHEQIRELFFHSHRLIYRVKESGTVEVVRVWHSARRLRESDLGEKE